MLEIWDKEENTGATYVFEGNGKGLSAGLKFSVAITLSGGDWNLFTAPRYIAVSDFGGPAMFEFAGAAAVANSYGPTSFSFRPLHWYSPGPSFRIGNFQMGRTIGTPGLTLGETTGTLKYLGESKGSQ